MIAEDYITDLIETDASLTALIGDRFFFGTVPQETTTYPYLYLELERSQQVCKDDEQFEFSLTFMPFAEDYSTARNVSDAIHNLFDYNANTQATFIFENETPAFDEALKLYGRELNYKLVYKDL